MRRFVTSCVVLALAAAPAGLLADDSSKPADADSAAQSGPAALFDKLDANLDGQVTTDEVPEEQKQLFDRLVRKSDADGNGQLSKEEFVASLADTRPERPDDAPQAGPAAAADPEVMFARLDANGDGKIVVDEVPEPLRERIRNLLARADKDNDSALSRDEFRAVTQPSPVTPPTTPEEMIQRLKQADADGDGKLSFEESPPRLQENFDLIDTNKDGFLDDQEILQRLQGGQAAGQELLRRIKQADANGDGMLNMEEAPDQLKRQFARIDANGDGQLEEQELRQALQAMAQRAGEGMRIRLKRLDADGDGKISREEAPGPLKRNFDSLDKNQDGFIDQTEARQINRNRPNQNPNKPKGPDAT